MRFWVGPPSGDDDLAGPAVCPNCGREAAVYRRVLFGGIVCVACAEASDTADVNGEEGS